MLAMRWDQSFVDARTCESKDVVDFLKDGSLGRKTANVAVRWDIWCGGHSTDLASVADYRTRASH